MDCFNHNCPIRNNTTSSPNRCECVACPNRWEEAYTFYVSNRISTTDVAPVIHGRWIYEGDFDVWLCSRCGKGVNHNPEGIDLYCYHCGAKMDEKE